MYVDQTENVCNGSAAKLNVVTRTGTAWLFAWRETSRGFAKALLLAVTASRGLFCGRRLRAEPPSDLRASIFVLILAAMLMVSGGAADACETQQPPDSGSDSSDGVVDTHVAADSAKCSSPKGRGSDAASTINASFQVPVLTTNQTRTQATADDENLRFPDSTATGRVLSSDGQPVVGAEVRALRKANADGSDRAFAEQGQGFFGWVFAKTDASGRFRIDRLRPKNEYLMVIAGPDRSRAICTTLIAGVRDMAIQLPPRVDLRIRVLGDLDWIPRTKDDAEPTLDVG